MSPLRSATWSSLESSFSLWKASAKHSLETSDRTRVLQEIVTLEFLYVFIRPMTRDILHSGILLYWMLSAYIAAALLNGITLPGKEEF